MSAAEVRLVGEMYEAFARRDAAAVLERLHPDVEIHQSELVPWGGHYRGHEGAREFFGRVLGAIDSTVTIERFIDAGDHVAAVGRTRGHVRASRRRLRRWPSSTCGPCGTRGSRGSRCTSTRRPCGRRWAPPDRPGRARRPAAPRPGYSAGAMSEPYDFDLVAIGSGPAGQRAAVQAAKLGKRVAVVEKNRCVGGVCVETGTIPSKTFREAVWAVRAAVRARRPPDRRAAPGPRQRRRAAGDRGAGRPAPPERRRRDPGRGAVPGSPHARGPVGVREPGGARRLDRRRRRHPGRHPARGGPRRRGGDHQRRHRRSQAPAPGDDRGRRRRHRDRVRVDLRRARGGGDAWSSGGTGRSSSWTGRSSTS